MKNVNKVKRELFIKMYEQRNNAWNIKDFKKCSELRAEEQKNYEKYMFLDKITKAIEKGNKNGKNE